MSSRPTCGLGLGVGIVASVAIDPAAGQRFRGHRCFAPVPDPYHLDRVSARHFAAQFCLRLHPAVRPASDAAAGRSRDRGARRRGPGRAVPQDLAAGAVRRARSRERAADRRAAAEAARRGRPRLAPADRAVDPRRARHAWTATSHARRTRRLPARRHTPGRYARCALGAGTLRQRARGAAVSQAHRRGDHALRSARPADGVRAPAGRRARPLGGDRTARCQHHRAAAVHDRWCAGASADASLGARSSASTWCGAWAADGGGTRSVCGRVSL